MFFPDEESLPPPIIPRVEVAHRTIFVERGDISDYIRFTGGITPARQYNLYLDVPSAILIEHSISPDIRARAVRTGDISSHNIRVEVEDVLAVFANEDIEAQVSSLQRSLDLARINYNTALREWESANAHYTQVRNRTERERQNAEDVYAAAQIRYQLDDTHSAALRQAQIRYEFGDISAASLRQAELDYEDAVRQSERNLRQAETDYRNTIWQLEQSLRTARADAGDDGAVRRERINLTAAEEGLQELQDRIESFVLRAPVNGVITFFDDLIIGGTYSSDQRLFTIADDSAFFITVVLTEMQIIAGHPFTPGTEVQLSTSVTINNERYPIEFEGTVLSITTDQMRAALLTEDTVVIGVSNWPEHISLATPSVTVSVLQASRYDVVTIPHSALNMTGTYSFVRVVEDGVSRERPVELGLITASHIEILSGLEPGEEIVVR